MDVHAEAGPLHVQTVDEPPGGATVTVAAAEFQVQTVLESDGELSEDDLQPGAGAQTPAAAAGDPITEIESEEGAQAGTDTPTEDIVGQSTGKAETVGSSCSNESCIPTPGCRICFQGAEQVKSGRSFVPSALFIVGLCIYASHWRLWFLPGLCAIQNWTESEPFKCELNLNWGKTEIESECQEVHLLI